MKTISLSLFNHNQIIILQIFVTLRNLKLPTFLENPLQFDPDDSFFLLFTHFQIKTDYKY